MADEAPPEGFTLDLEASRQDEAKAAGVTERDVELEVPDDELDPDGESGDADDDDAVDDPDDDHPEEDV